MDHPDQSRAVPSRYPLDAGALNHALNLAMNDVGVNDGAVNHEAVNDHVMHDTVVNDHDMHDHAMNDYAVEGLADTAALVVVDVQRGFDDDLYWGARNNPQFERNLVALLAEWRRSGRPIVLVRHDSEEPESPLRPGQPGNDFTEAVSGVIPDLLVAKSVNSSFLGTPDLAQWLRARNIRQIVLAGISTNTCVETTARMGGNLGFDVLFALDATYAFELTGSNGVTLTAEQLSLATAVNLSAGGFARVVSTAALTNASMASFGR